MKTNGHVIQIEKKLSYYKGKGGWRVVATVKKSALAAFDVFLPFISRKRVQYHLEGLHFEKVILDGNMPYLDKEEVLMVIIYAEVRDYGLIQKKRVSVTCHVRKNKESFAGRSKSKI